MDPLHRKGSIMENCACRQRVFEAPALAMPARGQGSGGAPAFDGEKTLLTPGTRDPLSHADIAPEDAAVDEQPNLMDVVDEASMARSSPPTYSTGRSSVTPTASPGPRAASRRPACRRASS
jgi:hypothetical protein